MRSTTRVVRPIPGRVEWKFRSMTLRYWILVHADGSWQAFFEPRRRYRGKHKRRRALTFGNRVQTEIYGGATGSPARNGFVTYIRVELPPAHPAPPRFPARTARNASAQRTSYGHR